MKYNREQLFRLWNSVPYREFRYWAFVKDNGTWLHSDSKYSTKQTFATFEEFYNFVCGLQAKDIHVKQTIMGGREWIIDVDHSDTESEIIELKNVIAHCFFKNFFGNSCTKIMFSGNRGLHVWLNSDDFDMDTSAKKRLYYLKCVFQKLPKRLNYNLLRDKSIGKHFFNVFENEYVKRQIAKLYPNIKMSNKDALLKEFFPNVDAQVFGSKKQIRAPYSYNSKGDKYSTDHIIPYDELPHFRDGVFQQQPKN
uniref:PxGV-Corf53 protein n=1 Tax=Plutella xylostella granulovirus TaxID=98383 RepID=A0A142DW14_9BBAC|nr:PxGV-Corf53 protein [Plutella xylostella granulovirus]AMQ35782.1 PxGV-Korf53 protein [Plutella xylostella granulovirus]AMQ36016.1 PxGV-Torf53 protein [Plutella xylostella granulovirus]